jgi:methyl-accepting chemotaxis protein
MKLSISAKLRLGFLALGALFIISSLFVFRSVNQVQSQTTNLIQNDLPTVDASRHLGQSLQSMVSSLRGFMLTMGNEEYVAAYRSEVSQLIDAADIRFISLESLVDAEKYAELTELWDTIKYDAGEVLELGHTDEDLPAHELFINEAAPIAEVALDQLQGLINDEASRSEGGERKRLFKLYADGYTTLANALASLRDYLQYGQQDYLNKYNDFMKSHQNVVKEIGSMESLLSDSDESLWSLFKEMQALYLPLANQVVSLRQSSQWNQTNFIMDISLVPSLKEMESQLNDIVVTQQQGVITTEDNIAESVVMVISLLVASCVIAVVSALVISTYMGRHIGQRVALISQRAQSIAGGDVSHEPLQETGGDELTYLTSAINSMNNALATLVGGVTSNAQSVHQRMEQVATSSKATVNQVEQQSSHIQEMGLSLSEVAVGAEQTAQQVSISSQALMESKQELRNGELALSDNQNSMAELASAIETTQVIAAQLVTESDSIGKVTEVIEGLAEQTNLLALNAAIEAARAGDQGRGFAVVADEVRMLASRTTESTTEINAIIQAIQASTSKVVEQIHVGSKMAETAVNHTELATSKIKLTGEQVDIVNDQMASLSATAEQQAQATQSISNLVNTINESLKTVASQSRHADDITESVRQSVKELHQQVDKFTV